MTAKNDKPVMVRFETQPEAPAPETPELVAKELEERIAPKLSLNHNELQVQDLEERVAPKLGLNHNELQVQELEERVAPRMSL